MNTDPNATMASDSGFLHAILLDGRGGGRVLGPEEVDAWRPEDGVLWLHLDALATEARARLEADADLPAVARDVLLARETRPRLTRLENGLLLVLRGVNLNAGADPSDMVSIRLFLDPHRVVSTSRRRLLAVQDASGEIREGVGPTTPGGLVEGLAGRLLERMAPTLERLEDAIEASELECDTAGAKIALGDLANLRRRAIALRRHLVPQRTVLHGLHASRLEDWGPEGMQETDMLADTVTRYVEELDELTERAEVTHQLVAAKQAELLNERMLSLAILTALFLPLGLLVGLLGINVGGMPGVGSPYGFWLATALVVAIGLLEVWLLRRKRWW